MKSIGIVRRIDDLGRVVIPKEVRRTLGMAEGDPVEIFVQGESVVFKKYRKGCELCGTSDHPMTPIYPDRMICTACVSNILENAPRLEKEARTV